MTRAIEKGDFGEICRVLKLIGLSPRTYASASGNLLHVIASFGVASLVSDLLAAGVELNDQNSNGDTPLHVASRIGRASVIDALLVREDLDDTILNKAGKNAYQVAKNRQIATALEYARSIYINRKTNQMHAMASSLDFEGLRNLFDSPRNKVVLSIDAPDSHGDTILHKAAKMDNLELVKICLDLKADAFFKNKKNKLPVELAKDEQVKALLKDGTPTLLY